MDAVWFELLVRDVRMGIRSLMVHKLRSFLTTLGVVFGVGSVIAMLAVGEGASKEALEQIRRLGSQNIIITSVKPTEDDSAGAGRTSFMSVYGILYDDEERIRETVPGVRRTVPAKLIRKEGRLKNRVLELRIVGTTPEWAELVDREMIAGRGLAPLDLMQRRNVCVLTEFGARRLLATEETIGQAVRIGGNAFEVIGIVRSEQGAAGAIQTPDQEIDAYIPITTCRERFGDVLAQRTAGSETRELVELHQLIVEVENTEHVAAVAAAIEDMLKRFHKRQDYRISVPLALLREAEATKRRFNIVLGSIAAISLVVGGIGIMNIMLASITERIQEIGVRRAIGARKRQIAAQFLIETVVLSCVGGAAGIGLGVLIPKMITRFAGMPTIITTFSLALSLGISLSVGIVFGFYPALRAANLNPITALRHE